MNGIELSFCGKVEIYMASLSFSAYANVKILCIFPNNEGVKGFTALDLNRQGNFRIALCRPQVHILVEMKAKG